MRLEDIKISSVVHSLAGVILLGTVALFGYEVRKPNVVRANLAPMAAKSSPLDAPTDKPEQLNRLPRLSERFQRKVIYYGIRRKWSPAGNKFSLKQSAGKVYTASSARIHADD